MNFLQLFASTSWIYIWKKASKSKKRFDAPWNARKSMFLYLKKQHNWSKFQIFWTSFDWNFCTYFWNSETDRSKTWCWSTFLIYNINNNMTEIFKLIWKFQSFGCLGLDFCKSFGFWKLRKFWKNFLTSIDQKVQKTRKIERQKFFFPNALP